MRISEKTVELNFCKGLPLALGFDLFWFGLTQKQEAKGGFDACAKSGSTLLLFQLKASNIVMKNGSRRFLAEHNQMQVLRNQVKVNRAVFYVLPIVGTTLEASACGGLCFSHCSRYLDVSQLPAVIPPPTAKGSSPPASRKSGCHYVDMSASHLTATIHSDPFDANLLSVEDVVKQLKKTDAVDREKVKLNELGNTAQSENAAEFQEFWSDLSRIDRKLMVGAYMV